MEIIKQEDSTFTVLKLQGRVDSFNSPLLSDSFDTIHKEKKYKILLDLSEVDFINSTALGLLIEVMKRNNENSGTLALINCSEKVNKILQITKLDKIFSVFNDIESAKRSLGL